MTVQENLSFPLEVRKLSKTEVEDKVKKALDIAYKRIYKFHSLQKFKNISYTDNLKNKLEYKYLPLDLHILNHFSRVCNKS